MFREANREFWLMAMCSLSCFGIVIFPVIGEGQAESVVGSPAVHKNGPSVDKTDRGEGSGTFILALENGARGQGRATVVIDTSAIEGAHSTSLGEALRREVANYPGYLLIQVETTNTRSRSDIQLLESEAFHGHDPEKAICVLDARLSYSGTQGLVEEDISSGIQGSEIGQDLACFFASRRLASEILERASKLLGGERGVESDSEEVGTGKNKSGPEYWSAGGKTPTEQETRPKSSLELEFSAQKPLRVALLPFKYQGEAFEPIVAAIMSCLDNSSEFILVDRRDLEPYKIESQLKAAQPLEIRAASALITGGIDPSQRGVRISAQMFARTGELLSGALVEAASWEVCESLNLLMDKIEAGFFGGRLGTLKIEDNIPMGTRAILEPIAPEDASDFRSKKRFEDLTKENLCTVKGIIPGWYFLTLDRPGFTFEQHGLNGSEFKVIGDVPYFITSGRNLRFDEVSGGEYVVEIKGNVDASFDEKIQFEKAVGSVPEVDVRGFGALRLEEFRVSGSEAREFKSFLVSESLMLNDGLGDKHKFRAADVQHGEAGWLDRFNGGCLIADDYRGGQLPVGEYQFLLWHPDYEMGVAPVTLKEDSPIRTNEADLIVLEKRKAEVSVLIDREVPRAAAIFECEDDWKIERDLKVENFRAPLMLPVGSCVAKTSVMGMGLWEKKFDIKVESREPPTLKKLTKSESSILSLALRSEGCRIEDGCCFSKLLEAGEGNALTGESTVSALEKMEVLVKTGPWVGSFIDLDAKAIFSSVDLDTSYFIEMDLVERLRRNSAEMGEGMLLKQTLDKDYRVSGREPSFSGYSLDMIIVDDEVLGSLARYPEAVVDFERYIQGGGVVLVLATELGSIQGILPRGIEVVGKDSARELSLSNSSSRQERVKLPLKAKKSFPRVSWQDDDWNVLVYRSRKQPWILKAQSGKGAVYLWLVDESLLRAEILDSLRVSGDRMKLIADALSGAQVLAKDSLLDRQGAPVGSGL